MNANPTDQPHSSSTPPDYGYAFEPACHPDHPAHDRLSMVLRAHPTQAHFDPERVTLPIITRGDQIEALHLVHPWPADHTYRAALGRVILVDRIGKKVEAFTFGGELTLTSAPAHVVAHLVSPAPILALQFPDTVSYHLASAVEALLAHRRAELDMAGRPDQLETRLAQVPPAELYQACLHALHQRLREAYVAPGERALAPFVSHALQPTARPLAELL